ncbi:MAG: FHA domain-containing protein [Anaerolineales bacterium]|nr:FHA domain-containing protein [Anaerolineales bacterium]
MKRTLLALAMVLAALWHSHPAAAQTGATLHLSQLETEAFPTILGYFSARDAAGQPIPGLTVEDFQVLENGLPRPLSQLREVQPGLRIVVALSPTDAFTIRDAQARTRFDYVREAMLTWAGGVPPNDSIMGLVTSAGPLVTDVPLPQWSAALTDWLPAPTPAADLQPLELALQIAAQPAPRPGGGSAVWWVTSSPSLADMSVLVGWQPQLVEQGIPLFIWQIGSVSSFSSETSLQLAAMAQATGGQWFGFSGGEVFPAPEDYFRGFRSAYFFQYDSTLHSSGAHEVQLRMDSQAGQATSAAHIFNLEIDPPNPILVSPPVRIERRPSEADPQQLSPFSQPLEIIVEFPDNIERGLQRTTLFVDGVQVAENRSAPFTRFVWDLSGYTSSQPVTLRVEAQDTLGLIGSSVEIPVQIGVSIPPSRLQTLLDRGGTWLMAGGVVLAAGAVLLVLVLSGRLRPRQPGARRRSRRVTPLPAAGPDPLSDTPLLDAIVPLPFEGGEAADNRPPAWLQRLNVQEADQPAEVFPIFGNETFVGRDAQNNLVLQDESISGRHTQISRQPDGIYSVADLGSQAGTWINYAPISPEGSQLQDGDLLHIGRVAFRFLINPSQDDPL